MARVSIVCPCFNAERYVGEAIESVLAQTFHDWEMLVVDDGSADKSSLVVEGLAAADPRVSLHHQVNGGVAKARNVGAAATKGEFLLFLDADDRLAPTMIDCVVAYLDGHPDVGAAYCGWRYIDENGNEPAQSVNRLLERRVASGWRARRVPDSEPTTAFESIFTAAGLAPSLVVIRRSAFEVVGGFDETFGQPGEDTHLFLQLALLAPIHFIAKPLVDYRVHGGQNTEDVEKLGHQWDKLLDRWSKYQTLPVAQRDTVRRAWLFRERQYVASNAARRLLFEVRRGRPIAGLRFAAGTTRMVIRSLLLGPPPRARRQRPSPDPAGRV